MQSQIEVKLYTANSTGTTVLMHFHMQNLQLCCRHCDFENHFSNTIKSAKNGGKTYAVLYLAWVSLTTHKQVFTRDVWHGYPKDIFVICKPAAMLS